MIPSLQLRTSQHLALTPQLQQSIRLLQLSTLELGAEVEQMLDENPFLERTQDEAAREEFGLDKADVPVRADDRDAEREQYDAPEYIAKNDGGTSGEGQKSAETESSESAEPLDQPNWDGDGTTDIAPDDGEWGGDAPARSNNLDGDGEADATELARSQQSLQDHLHRQALALRLSEEDCAALRFLIESLNDDGYLDESIEALAAGLSGGNLGDANGAASDPDPEQVAAFEELVHRFTVALRLLQSLEPVGVGARALSECLSLQLRALKPASDQQAAHACALRICDKPLDLLARRDLRKLAQVCGDSDEDLRAAITLIGRLEPKPGRRFIDVERNVVVPDVIVSQIGNSAKPKFRVQLNADVMPRLKVHDIYANALRGHRSGSGDAAGYAALQQRLQEARWFIKNIQQRFDTILRVSNAIVERQKGFFSHGEVAMRPLVLREIAEELGMHESTISRVTTAKYMATPFGTFELKYFFGSGLATETGGNASSTAVRALIKQFVAAENPAKPLSDGAISEMLKEQGIECARRTVAKYREALKIAPTSLRRAL
ncbi:MAG: RNA polymerase factor sigma-54 [Burkholderiales bacterium]